MKANCKNCGPIEEFSFDGYAIGERLLEGILFEVKWNGNAYDVKVEESARSYFSSLNQEHWLSVAREYAENLDICPKCDDMIERDDRPKVEPREIRLDRADDVIARIKGRRFGDL